VGKHATHDAWDIGDRANVSDALPERARGRSRLGLCEAGARLTPSSRPATPLGRALLGLGTARDLDAGALRDHRAVLAGDARRHQQRRGDGLLD
jgi:hypothetical protein